MTADDAKVGGQPRVHDTHVLVTQTLEQPVRHFIRQDELHLDGYLSGKLVEMLAVEHPVTPETLERAKGRAAMHAELFRIHEQPLVQKLMAMQDVVMHV